MRKCEKNLKKHKNPCTVRRTYQLNVIQNRDSNGNGWITK